LLSAAVSGAGRIVEDDRAAAAIQCRETTAPVGILAIESQGFSWRLEALSPKRSHTSALASQRHLCGALMTEFGNSNKTTSFRAASAGWRTNVSRKSFSEVPSQ
jgi:hypothetical protein